ncbi:hypothetical protein [Mycolicibacterium fallax]|nr:hypothetical protein [Mycolicibacterium fallax]BBY97354.1 hypothetical protein MFAL_08210 [Mycolicibacterium fallax]
MVAPERPGTMPEGAGVPGSGRSSVLLFPRVVRGFLPVPWMEVRAARASAVGVAVAVSVIVYR